MVNILKSIFTRYYSTMSNTILMERLGNIITIGINRPDKRNCVNFETGRLLKNAINEFEEDDKMYAAVLYGTGGNFCSGFDLEELSNMGNVENVPKGLGIMGPTLKSFTRKPIVAAISGYAVAGGFELALMCDLRVMEDNAIVGVYNRRWGVPLIDGGTVRLQAIVGLSRALDLILTGRSLDAKEAFEWGVANRVVACGTALGQAIQLAGSLTKFPQECLLADRDSTYNAAFNSAFNELIKYEQNNTKVLGKESIEGANKFISGVGRHGKSYDLKEKQKPDWEKEYDSNLVKNPKWKLG